jgi:hypothetical protein
MLPFPQKQPQGSLWRASPQGDIPRTECRGERVAPFQIRGGYRGSGGLQIICGVRTGLSFITSEGW